MNFKSIRSEVGFFTKGEAAAALKRQGTRPEMSEEWRISEGGDGAANL